MGQSTNFNNRLDTALFENPEELTAHQIKEEFDRENQAQKQKRPLNVTKQDEIELVNSRYDKLCFKNDKLDQFLNSIDEEFEERKESLSFKKRKIDALRNELKAKRDEYYSKLQKQDKESKLAHNLKEAIEDNEDKYRKLSVALGELDTKIHSISYDNDRMKLHLEQKINKSQKVREEITNKDLKLKGLLARSEKLKKEIEDFPELEEVAKQIQATNINDLNAKQEEIKRLNEERSVLSQRLNKVIRKNEEQNSMLIELDNKIKNHIHWVNQAEKKEVQLRNENSEFQKEIGMKLSAVRQIKAETQDRNEKMDEVILENKSLSGKNKALEAQINQLLQGAYKSKQDAIKLKQENVSLNEGISKKLNKLKIITAQYKQAKNETDNTMVSYNEQKELSARLTNDINKKQAALAELKMKKEQTRQDFTKIASRIQQKREKVKALNSEIENLHDEYESLNNLLERQSSLEKFL